MKDGMLIADAVVHGYNWHEENYVNEWSPTLVDATYGAHSGIFSSAGPSQLTREEFAANWQSEDVEAALVHESEVDLIAYHGTPIWDFWKDGHSYYKKGLELRERHPGRVLIYAPLNPYHGARALEDMKYFVEEVGVDGLKVFAASYHEGRTLSQPLNDPHVAYPFIEAALDLGVKVLATHKAIPIGPVRGAEYRMDDMDEPASRYPEMNFEVVHSGFAFLEETAMLVDRHPNVYANLEATNSFINTQPRRFAQVLGTFLWFGGEDRIIYASGTPLVHPKQTVDAISAFEMPQDLIEGWGFTEFTEERKRKFLGENYMRLHGIDVEEFKSKVAGDAWETARAETGIQEPWSHVRNKVSA